MADAKREIERKYESDDSGLPDLTGIAGVANVLDKGTAELDATYHDTSDLRLASARVTLRRRTGGADAGWHLKLPVAPGIRDEIHARLSDTLPDELAGLARSRVREGRLVPVVRLRTTREVQHLVDADGKLLAELSVDHVRAERLFGGAGKAQWTEIEVELAEGGDPAFLDKVEKRLGKAGVRPSGSASKLARALSETAKSGKPKPEKAGKAGAAGKAEKPGAAGKPGKAGAAEEPGKLGAAGKAGAAEEPGKLGAAGKAGAAEEPGKLGAAGK
ncbi:CYTH domain-containing protein, partial [Streptomyces sp. NPDC048277]|uniref:CYTH domain-containing protein n=1 Tax=Streptomyces sp. NPDC048277 TaxID=3155027 RepID=UPI0033DE6C06